MKISKYLKGQNKSWGDEMFTILIIGGGFMVYIHIKLFIKFYFLNVQFIICQLLAAAAAAYLNKDV